MMSARSIWSQAAPKFCRGAEVGAAGAEYSWSRAACGWPGWVPERAWRRSWFFRSWLMAPVLVKRTRSRLSPVLGAGSQPDGQAAGGDVVEALPRASAARCRRR